MKLIKFGKCLQFFCNLVHINAKNPFLSSILHNKILSQARDPHMRPGCWPSSATLFGLSVYKIRSDERGLVWDKQRGKVFVFRKSCMKFSGWRMGCTMIKLYINVSSLRASVSWTCKHQLIPKSSDVRYS